MKKKFIDVFGAWVQAIGFIVVAALGFYQWFYKEVFIPKTAPANVSMSLELRTAAPSLTPNSPMANSLAAIEAKITVTNTSSRVIYLLQGIWIAYAYKLAPSNNPLKPFSRVDFGANEIVFGGPGSAEISERNIEIKSFIVGFGWLLPLEHYSSLAPSQSVSYMKPIVVPTGQYNLVGVQTFLPTSPVEKATDAEFTLHPKTKAYNVRYYRLDSNGNRMPYIENRKQQTKWLEGIQLQEARCSADLFLPLGQSVNSTDPTPR